jgi:effector-binding domain-containing protein
MNTRMPVEPSIVDRPEQPYVAIKGFVTMDTFGAIADRFPEVFGWLEARGIAPTGPPFFKYDVIDMERQLEVDAGVPVATVVEGEGDVFADVLPSGRYVTLTHVGHPDELINVTGDLLTWAEEHGLAWDVVDTAAGQRWGGRLEVLKTNPADEPDMAKWETELVFRLKD